MPQIKQTLENILTSRVLTSRRLRLVFDRIQLEEHDIDSGAGWIYVFASKRNKVLDMLQKQVREELPEYSNYYFKDSSEYESNFRPHITIARELDSDAFAYALKELPSQITLDGEVTSIVLACVKDVSLEEASNPDNLTVYPL